MESSRLSANFFLEEGGGGAADNWAGERCGGRGRKSDAVRARRRK